MPELERWVQRYVRRVGFGEFLRDAADWLAGLCFVFGGAVLIVKLRLPEWWPRVLWLAAAAIPVMWVAWRLSRRRWLSARQAVALLDQKLQAGGLLMSVHETADVRWTPKLPKLERLWQNALPQFQPARFAKVLVLPVVFAAASCLVPLRSFDEPIAKGAVAQQAMQRLEELMQQLEEARVIQSDDDESEQLRAELEKLAQETKERPLTHEKWETVDALQEKMKAKLDRSANETGHARDSLLSLTNALGGAFEKLSEEQLERLESDLAKAMEKLAQGGALTKLPEGLQGKLGELARVGKFALPKDPGERDALLAELREHLDREAKKLAELQAQNGGAQLQQAGKGGVSEGRGEAELNFGDESNANGSKFKETALPPGFLDKTRDEVAGLTLSLPDIKPVESAPRNKARSQESTTGNETWNRNVRPRHRSVVKSYFSDK